MKHVYTDGSAPERLVRLDKFSPAREKQKKQTKQKSHLITMQNH